MRTNIEIEDTLLQTAMNEGAFLTKKAAVDAGLRRVARIQGQRRILELFGTVQWEGNLEESRRNRFPEWQEREG